MAILIKRWYVFLLIIIMAFFIGNYKIDKANAKFLVDGQLSEVVNINKNTHNLMKYRIGLNDGSSADEIVKYGEQECGNFSYLMLRELKINGIQARTVGVISSYKDAVHSFVEVKINGEWYTFDPTFNVYYPYSIQEMADNPHLARSMVGTPSEKVAYTEEDFFKNAVSMHYYYSIDTIDKKINVLNDGTKIISNTKFYEPDYGLNMAFDDNYNTFAAADEYTFPQDFVLEFNSLKQIYRIKIIWLDNENVEKSFQVDYFDEKTQRYEALLKEDNYKDATNDNIYEYILKKPINTKSIRFILHDTYGQKRILLREFLLYR